MRQDRDDAEHVGHQRDLQGLVGWNSDDGSDRHGAELVGPEGGRGRRQDSAQGATPRRSGSPTAGEIETRGRLRRGRSPRRPCSQASRLSEPRERDRRRARRANAPRSRTSTSRTRTGSHAGTCAGQPSRRAAAPARTPRAARACRRVAAIRWLRPRRRRRSRTRAARGGRPPARSGRTPSRPWPCTGVRLEISTIRTPRRGARAAPRCRGSRQSSARRQRER